MRNYKPNYPPSRDVRVVLSTPYRHRVTVHRMKRWSTELACGTVAMNLSYIPFGVLNEMRVYPCRRCWRVS